MRLVDGATAHVCAECGSELEAVRVLIRMVAKGGRRVIRTQRCLVYANDMLTPPAAVCMLREASVNLLGNVCASMPSGAVRQSHGLEFL